MQSLEFTGKTPVRVIDGGLIRLKLAERLVNRGCARPAGVEEIPMTRSGLLQAIVKNGVEMIQEGGAPRPRSPRPAPRLMWPAWFTPAMESRTPGRNEHAVDLRTALPQYAEWPSERHNVCV